MGELEEVQGHKDLFLERQPSVEEAGDQHRQVVVQIPRVAARTITGPANFQNQGAIDWGQHGLLAYGSNYTVVILDSRNIQPVQCLDKHKSMVNNVVWGKITRERISSELATMSLASSDTTGHIILWDVATGIPQAVLQEGNKPVLDRNIYLVFVWLVDLQWMAGYDSTHHLLAALHPPYSLVIWDTKSKAKLWKKTYTETLVSFSFDPFSPTNMASPMETPLSIGSLDRHYRSRFPTPIGSSLFSHWTRPDSSGGYLTQWFLVLCSDCILFVDDFVPSKIPSSNGRKFYISSPRVNLASSGARGSTTNLTSVGTEEKHRAKDRLRRLMKDLVIGETKPRPDDYMTVSECLQLSYHSSLRHHLLLLYAREVLLLDLHINQTVGIIPLEKTASPLLQVLISVVLNPSLRTYRITSALEVLLDKKQLSSLPADVKRNYLDFVISSRQRDVLYCLHESGSVSAKFRRRQLAFVGSPLDAPAGSVSSLDMGSFSSDIFMELGYEQRCQSEVIRLTKGSKVLGMALAPVCERRIALFLNTGKVVFLELRPANGEPMLPPTFAIPEMSPGVQQIHLPHPRNPTVPPRKETLGELVGPLLNENGPPIPLLRLLVTGLLSGAVSPLTVVRMCPPLTTRNWQKYTPLLAAGTTEGIIQVYNMATGTVDKELIVHTCTVRGVEWTNLTSFLSFAHPNVIGSNAQVRNEVMLTDTMTGHSIALRTDKGEEQPIDMLRVSPLKQYFVVILKDGPFELWDLRSLSILRVMPKKFPTVTALEWSPIHNLKTLKKKLASVEEKEQAEPANLAANTNSGDSGRSDSQDKQLVVREHFVFSDSESQLYHFSVEGNLVRDGIKIPPETGVGTVTCIAFKNDQIVQGDVDGLLNIWDLKGKSSKNVHTGRGWIKKMRFAPGKGNLKLLVLYSDGVDIVDLKKQYERISQLKCPKDMVKVLDIDWAASDKPVLATQDGCLRIMDMMLTASFSPIIDYEFQDPLFCHTMLPNVAIMNLQLQLSGQFWNDNYTLDFNMQHGFTLPHLQEVHEQLGMLEEEDLLYLQHCPLGTAERSLMAAQLLSDQSEVDFWTVALYYLQITKLESKNINKVYMAEHSTGGDLVSMGSPSVLDTKRINRYPHLQPLDTCYDVLCEPYTYQRLQLERVSLHESKRGDYKHTKMVIEQLILLGEMDRAVQLLLETELENTNYYTDAIKLVQVSIKSTRYYPGVVSGEDMGLFHRACLVATIQSTGAAQSTIKLVATNLIANGNIWEGVQLLCLIGTKNHLQFTRPRFKTLISPSSAVELNTTSALANYATEAGKGLDACRYLMSYNLWDRAVWLAKAVLPQPETQEVMRKWADRLWTLDHKHQAMLVMLSLGQFERVLEMLGTLRLHARAGLLLQACREFGLVSDGALADILYITSICH
uniref:WD repeat-containing protein 11 n=1 Tax=Timema shepardi TaxID=629360 RepID=A0A7R9ASP6_TIMSH|nr:unnamed protein product [Timema shepardi]